jgi:hypothetical protein
MSRNTSPHLQVTETRRHSYKWQKHVTTFTSDRNTSPHLQVTETRRHIYKWQKHVATFTSDNKLAVFWLKYILRNILVRIFPIRSYGNFTVGKNSSHLLLTYGSAPHIKLAPYGRNLVTIRAGSTALNQTCHFIKHLIKNRFPVLISNNPLTAAVRIRSYPLQGHLLVGSGNGTSSIIPPMLHTPSFIYQ